QFGEFGYDVDIEQNGRTGIKPTKWEYLDLVPRKKLYEVYKALIALRKMEALQDGDFRWVSQGNLKSIHIDHSNMNVTIIGNFGITEEAIDPDFQSTGQWYDFFSGEQYDIQDTSQPFNLSPGEFHVFTDVQLVTPDGDLITELPELPEQSPIRLFPNPSRSHLSIGFDYNSTGQYEIKFSDLAGRQLKSYRLTPTSNTGIERLSTFDLTSGIYIVQVISDRYKYSQKIIVDK
ncbi:MAG: T9SS type A sorting domain-containing protein, partial [Cyclobacteriaceae bacterium]